MCSFLTEHEDKNVCLITFNDISGSPNLHNTGLKNNLVPLH